MIFYNFVLAKSDGKAEQALPALIEALKDENRFMRFEAAIALGYMGEEVEQIVPALVEALNDKDISVRYKAAYSLGQIGEQAEQAVPALIEVLKDYNVLMSSYAAEALGMIGGKAKQAIPHLKELLIGEKDIDVKFQASFALTKLERKRGEGSRIIDEMIEKGELEEDQIQLYNELCQELGF